MTGLGSNPENEEESTTAVVRLDAEFNVLWRTLLIPPPPLDPSSSSNYNSYGELVELPNGDVLVVSRRNGPVVLISGISASGEQLFAHDWTIEQAAFVGTTIIENVIPAVNGDLLISGSYYNYEDEEALEAYAYLLKVSENGEILWFQKYEESTVEHSLEYSRGVVQTNDGAYIMGLRTNSEQLGTKIKLIKTDEDGEEIWSKTYFQDQPEQVFLFKDLVQASNGDLVLVGDLLSGPNNNFLLRLNQEGEVVWYKAFQYIRKAKVKLY